MIINPNFAAIVAIILGKEPKDVKLDAYTNASNYFRTHHDIIVNGGNVGKSDLISKQIENLRLETAELNQQIFDAGSIPSFAKLVSEWQKQVKLNSTRISVIEHRLEVVSNFESMVLNPSLDFNKNTFNTKSITTKTEFNSDGGVESVTFEVKTNEIEDEEDVLITDYKTEMLKMNMLLRYIRFSKKSVNNYNGILYLGGVNAVMFQDLNAQNNALPNDEIVLYVDNLKKFTDFMTKTLKSSGLEPNKDYSFTTVLNKLTIEFDESDYCFVVYQIDSLKKLGSLEYQIQNGLKLLNPIQIINNTPSKIAKYLNKQDKDLALKVFMRLGIDKKYKDIL